MIMKENDKPTYTLWNGSNLVATYPHTREGSDAAFSAAHELTIGGYAAGTLAIYSSRDDLVWSSSDEDEAEATPEIFAELDAIYDECGEYDINSLFYN
jgi:hypothetical protein